VPPVTLFSSSSDNSILPFLLVLTGLSAGIFLLDFLFVSIIVSCDWLVIYGLPIVELCHFLWVKSSDPLKQRDLHGFTRVPSRESGLGVDSSGSDSASENGRKRRRGSRPRRGGEGWAYRPAL